MSPVEGSYTSFVGSQFKDGNGKKQPNDDLLILDTPAGTLNARSHEEVIPAEGIVNRLLRKQIRIPSVQAQFPGDSEMKPIPDLYASREYHVDGRTVTVKVVYRP